MGDWRGLFMGVRNIDGEESLERWRNIVRMNTLSVQDEFGVLHNESSRDVSRIQSIHPFTSDIDRKVIYKAIHQ